MRWVYETDSVTFSIKISGDWYVLLYSDDYDEDTFLLHDVSPEKLVASLILGNVPDIIYNRSAIIQDTAELNIPADLSRWRLDIG